MKTISARGLLTIVVSPALVTGLFAGTFFGESHEDALPVVPSHVAVPNLATAQQTTAVLADALVAAVASISNATPPGATPTEILAGSAAVSALVPGCQRTYRLLDATGCPLDYRNTARGRFEVRGLQQLAGGAPLVQSTVGNTLRTMVPLTNDMHPNCVTCHVHYGGLPPGTLVGAAALRVRL